MRITHISRYHLVLLFILPLPSLQASKNDEEDGPVYLDKDFLKLPTDTALDVPCYTEFNLTASASVDNVLALRLAWFDANGTDLNTLNDTRRYYTPEGELRIDQLRVEDSGVYMCALVSTFNKEAIYDDAPDLLNDVLQRNNDDGGTDGDNSDNPNTQEEGFVAFSVVQILENNLQLTQQYNATLELHVYVMPDYLAAGVVLLIINASLCVLFFICLIHSHFKQKAYINKLKQESDMKEPVIKEVKVST